MDGGVDVVLDDGSHECAIPRQPKVLFPRLSDGGVYMIEDLHTAYSGKFGGVDSSEQFLCRRAQRCRRPASLVSRPAAELA